MVYEEMGNAKLFAWLVIRKRTIKPWRKDAFGFPSEAVGRMQPAAIKFPWWSWGTAHNHK